MSEVGPEPMRERTRRIVQGELLIVAQNLFLTGGYEQTTVDQIAAAAGMSKRTFFRHFASKEDLVIGKYELFGDRMAEALRARPEAEPIWASLRALFDIALVYFVDGPERRVNEAMEVIVRTTPTLYAGYLEKISRIQSVVAQVAAERLSAQGPPAQGSPAQIPPADVALRAASVVGAAFACMNAAQAAWIDADGTKPIGQLLDNAMATIHIVS